MITLLVPKSTLQRFHKQYRRLRPRRWCHSKLGCRIKPERLPCSRYKTYQSTHHLPQGGAVMFSAWDFNSWIFSVGVMLFILSVLTGVGAFVTVLVSRIW